MATEPPNGTGRTGLVTSAQDRRWTAPAPDPTPAPVVPSGARRPRVLKSFLAGREPKGNETLRETHRRACEAIAKRTPLEPRWDLADEALVVEGTNGLLPKRAAHEAEWEPPDSLVRPTPAAPSAAYVEARMAR